jgi:hypothetical protein
MGIRDVNRLLPSNRLLFELRRDKRLLDRFQTDMEGMMTEYRLSEEEKQVWRDRDIKRLSEMGVHPYMVPQFSRLFYGSAYNSNDSVAAQQYRAALIGEEAAKK